MSICSTAVSRKARKGGGGFKVHTPYGDVEPLVVKPRIAWILLGCSNTKGYELLAAGELESFKDGKSRKITVASIHRYIAQRVAAGGPVHA
jgi:excisionase family DNA binding protein